MQPSHARRLALALALVLAGSARAALPAAADDTLNLILGSPAPNLGNAETILAEREGFFKQEHLIVNVQPAANPSLCAQLVASGKGDVCSLAIEPLISGYEHGLRLTVFLARIARFSYVLASPADGPLKTLADFNGAVLGEISPGSPAEIMANSMLSGAGLKPGSVSYIPIGFGASALTALTGKRVDALAFSYFEIVPYEVVAHQKFRIFYHPILADVSDVGFAASPAMIQSHGDILARFARGVVKADVFLRENPAAAARIYLDDVTKGKFTADDVRTNTQELAIERDYYPGSDPTSKRIGALSPDGIAYLCKALADAGVTHGVTPASALMTNQFIPFANDFDHGALIAMAKRAR
jgi:NitT/TauT family transport system substrate-binding protein